MKGRKDGQEEQEGKKDPRTGEVIRGEPSSFQSMACRVSRIAVRRREREEGEGGGVVDGGYCCDGGEEEEGCGC
jgi:hypothetical protein